MNEQENEQEKILFGKLKQALNERGYEYEKPLDEGSHGLVVRAKCLNEEKQNTYAIKCLPVVYDETAKYKRRELEILKNDGISHENIVKYGGSWTITIDKSQFLCIRMELCHINLWAFVYSNQMGNAEIIKARGSPRFYQHVFPQILKGLVAIHDDMGWVHRDIHPGNILIANPNPEEIRDITVKIADFGLAREIRSIIGSRNQNPLTEAPKLEKLSPHVGNEQLRAPELNTEHYDYKVDLYSAGIILYFLSRYLEDKRQWEKEIWAFRDGERRSDDLFHQDDKTLVKLIQLLMQERVKRPTAEEALKIAEGLAESQEPVESQILVESQKPVESQEPVEAQRHVETQRPIESQEPVESKKKRFFVKKACEEDAERCPMENDFPQNLPDLQAEIERITGIEPNSQILHQQTTIAGAERVKIKSDQHVRDMFNSADGAGKDVVIIVSESKRKERKFLVRKKGKRDLEYSIENDTLPSLKAEIEDIFEAECQVIHQEKMINGKKELIALTSDQQVRSMFESAEYTRDEVVVIASDNVSSQNERSTDDIHCEESKYHFLIQIEGCASFKEGL